MWAFFALVAAVYTFMWDVKMDWGLWTPHAKYKGLRDKLLYKPPLVR